MLKNYFENVKLENCDVIRFPSKFKLKIRPGD